jgi:hypothetical protein
MALQCTDSNSYISTQEVCRSRLVGIEKLAAQFDVGMQFVAVSRKDVTRNYDILPQRQPIIRKFGIIRSMMCLKLH